MEPEIEALRDEVDRDLMSELARADQEREDERVSLEMSEGVSEAVGWLTIAEEQDPNEGALFTQELQRGSHFIYRILHTTQAGGILDVIPLGVVHVDAGKP